MSLSDVVLPAAVVLVAALVKGAIGFGFPTLATPLLATVVDVKVAVPVLILPNIAMDSIQAGRRPGLRAAVRRLGVLLACGMVGTFIGTRALVGLSARAATLTLGVFIIAFVVVNAMPITLRVPARWEPWLSPPVGVVVGIVGGITNAPGTPLVMYFYALSLDKTEFVRATAVSFIVYKVAQLAAVLWYGLLPPSLFGWSVAVTAVALVGFRVGLAVQDRFDQKTFRVAVLGFLAALGIWLMVRAVIA